MEDFNSVFDELNQINEDKLLNKIKDNMHSAMDKDFESIVVGHLIFEAIKLNLDFKTQYPVRLADGNFYKIDLYFPQINLAVECDEGHHLQQVSADALRQAGISSTISATFIRINATSEGKTLIMQTDAVVEEMKQLKNSYNGAPVADFDYESEPAVLDKIKQHLIDTNATANFLNQPIKSGFYGSDAFHLEYDDGPIEYIDLAYRRTKLTIVLCYDQQYDDIVKQNINEFKQIANVNDARLGKKPNTLRLDVLNNKSKYELNSVIDIAVSVALEAKNKFLELIS